jgi:hypothetical protein
MPYEKPTVAQFKEQIQDLSGVWYPTIIVAIDEASLSVDQSWNEADYQPAILNLAAHIMVLEGAKLAEVPSGIGSEAKVYDALAADADDSASPA